MKRPPPRYRYLLVLLLFVIGRIAFAHGGEDHGAAAAVAVPEGRADAGRLTSYGVTNMFEVVVRYAPPELEKPSPFQFLISDYATNEPITGATFTLASSPSGLTLHSAAKMISPGVYSVDLLFPADTIYNLVLTLQAGNRTDLLEIKNIYSGDHAKKFLAAHSTPGSGGISPVGADQSGGVPSWIWWGGALFLAIAGGWFLLRRRRRTLVHDGNSKQPGVVHPSTNDDLKP